MAHPQPISLQEEWEPGSEGFPVSCLPCWLRGTWFPCSLSFPNSKMAMTPPWCWGALSEIRTCLGPSALHRCLRTPVGEHAPTSEHTILHFAHQHCKVGLSIRKLKVNQAENVHSEAWGIGGTSPSLCVWDPSCCMGGVLATPPPTGGRQARLAPGQ